MTDHEILHALTGVFHDVFVDPIAAVQMTTTADDVPEWDSMSQVTLGVEIEHRFHIKLKAAEMEQLRSVRDLVALIKLRSAS